MPFDDNNNFNNNFKNKFNDQFNNQNLNADELVKKVQQLIQKGNIARIRIMQGNEVILNVPLNVGVIGTALIAKGAPWALILGSVATVASSCRVELQKFDGQIVVLLGRAK